MTSGFKRADERRRGGLLAAAGSKRAVPWLVIGVRLVLEPAPHGVDAEPDFIRVEEPEGLATIGHDNKFRCSVNKCIETRVAHVKRERLTARPPTWWSRL